MQILPTVDGTLDEGDRCFREPFNLFVATYPEVAVVTSTGFINHITESGGEVDEYAWIAGPRRTRRDLRGRI